MTGFPDEAGTPAEVEPVLAGLPEPVRPLAAPGRSLILSLGLTLLGEAAVIWCRSGGSSRSGDTGPLSSGHPVDTGRLSSSRSRDADRRHSRR